MGMSRVVMVRHAENQSKLDGIVGGHRGCSGLSAGGRRQAALLEHRLARTRELVPEAIVTSVLPRAIQTAEVIAGALGRLPIEPDCAYCEVHVGDADGLTVTEARQRWQRPRQPAALPPGAEPVAAFGDRVATAVADLTDTYAGQTVLVVTHGGFIAAACYWFLGLPWQPERAMADRRFFLDPSYTGITEWTRLHHAGPWTLARYNDTAHLHR